MTRSGQAGSSVIKSVSLRRVVRAIFSTERCAERLQYGGGHSM